jgi:hypothetical protein
VPVLHLVLPPRHSRAARVTNKIRLKTRAFQKYRAFNFDLNYQMIRFFAQFLVSIQNVSCKHQICLYRKLCESIKRGFPDCTRLWMGRIRNRPHILNSFNRSKASKYEVGFDCLHRMLLTAYFVGKGFENLQIELFRSEAPEKF